MWHFCRNMVEITQFVEITAHLSSNGRVSKDYLTVTDIAEIMGWFLVTVSGSETKDVTLLYFLYNFFSPDMICNFFWVDILRLLMAPAYTYIYIHIYFNLRWMLIYYIVFVNTKLSEIVVFDLWCSWAFLKEIKRRFRTPINVDNSKEEKDTFAVEIFCLILFRNPKNK